MLSSNVDTENQNYLEIQEFLQWLILLKEFLVHLFYQDHY